MPNITGIACDRFMMKQRTNNEREKKRPGRKAIEKA
jgi:hypothetical protein